MTLRKILVPLTTRGNYAKTKSLLIALRNHPDIELQLVVGGILLAPDYNDFIDVIRSDGFYITGTIRYPADGGTPSCIGFASAKCMHSSISLFQDLVPDFVFVIADRYESLSIASAALCLNIRIAHLEGGEVSGSIDERIRHAITKLSHLHFVSNELASDRVIKMGENQDSFIT